MHSVIPGWFGLSSLWFIVLLWRLVRAMLPGGESLRGNSMRWLWAGFALVLFASCTLETMYIHLAGSDAVGRAINGVLVKLTHRRFIAPLAMGAMLLLGLPWLLGQRWLGLAARILGLPGIGSPREEAEQPRSRRPSRSDNTDRADYSASYAIGENRHTIAGHSLSGKRHSRWQRPVSWHPPLGKRDLAAAPSTNIPPAMLPEVEPQVKSVVHSGAYLAGEAIGMGSFVTAERLAAAQRVLGMHHVTSAGMAPPVSATATAPSPVLPMGTVAPRPHARSSASVARFLRRPATPAMPTGNAAAIPSSSPRLDEQIPKLDTPAAASLHPAVASSFGSSSPATIPYTSASLSPDEGATMLATLRAIRENAARWPTLATNHEYDASEPSDAGVNEPPSPAYAITSHAGHTDNAIMHNVDAPAPVTEPGFASSGSAALPAISPHDPLVEFAAQHASHALPVIPNFLRIARPVPVATSEMADMQAGTTSAVNQTPIAVNDPFFAKATTIAATPNVAPSSSSSSSFTQFAALFQPRGHSFTNVEFRQPTISPIALPGLDLLAHADAAIEHISDENLAATGHLIEQRLQEFRVPVTVVGASAGPVITRFEVEPAQGVRGSQIVGLMKDLSRGLGLTSIRVVETIPGKTCMGLELPNQRRQIIRLSEILESPQWQRATSKLTLALGKDIVGQPVVTDLAKAPHMLVAGTTGSGKSVAINAMILSLLYKATPEQVRLLMIDPKMLELSAYEGIAHLLAPVVTDMKLAANALHWCVGEMEKRYRLMSAVGVRNLAGFNQKIRDVAAQHKKIGNPFSLTPDAPEPLTTLPLIVVVIDELADLMMVVGKKVEELIARLAQKARAAGIHLILATQRPSVDVITGLIKANIPSRIAFQVSSKIDSRTILDQMGAETLLGMGDMLFLPPGTGYPQRIHGAFVADEEVHHVVEYLKQFGEPEYVDGILDGPTSDTQPDLFGDASDTETDPLYDEAVAFVVRTRRASISAVQRQLRIGYNRAARLVEQMETAGLVSPMGVNGSREVIVPATE